MNTIVDVVYQKHANVEKFQGVKTEKSKTQ